MDISLLHRVVQRLVSALRRHPELDEPKHGTGLHVSIGFLNTVPPFGADEEWDRLAPALDQLANTAVGRVTAQKVWLVHYANRTLARVVGRVPFNVGQANPLTVERLLRELGIATV